MLASAENSYLERIRWHSRGPAAVVDEDKQREAVFYYDRPVMEHLPFDEGFDPDKLEEAYQCYDKLGDGWAKYAASEVSDDGEGDPADGRISPCTFTRWAQGTRRWDDPVDKYKSVWEEQKEYEIPVSGHLPRHCRSHTPVYIPKYTLLTQGQQEDRQRPASPNTALPRRMKIRSMESLYDVHDGEQMSPVCSDYAVTEPSILWAAPRKFPLAATNTRAGR